MLQLAIDKYYSFFDETIQSSTFIVLMIACLIFATGNMSVNADDMTGDIRSAMIEKAELNRVIIDGVEYRLDFVRIAQ